MGSPWFGLDLSNEGGRKSPDFVRQSVTVEIEVDLRPRWPEKN